MTAAPDIPVGPGYQTAFSARIRAEAQIATGTVVMITEPAQAEHILRTGQADVVLLARELLRDPYWALHAEKVRRAYCSMASAVSASHPS
jgi:2,4-dienoyl-CoA reductase-like NADH-dependent reductase (Old Yellow Enzyme family)